MTDSHVLDDLIFIEHVALVAVSHVDGYIRSDDSRYLEALRLEATRRGLLGEYLGTDANGTPVYSDADGFLSI